MNHQSAAGLMPGERLMQTSRYPVLVYHHSGSSQRPLIVLAPGGGHLARIFYGHPGAEPRDFLATWLAALGYEVLAISYPSDHPAIAADCADMTVADWAESLAEATARTLRSRSPYRKVVLVGWSMAGRLAQAFTRHLTERGIAMSCFVSLAATAPLLNLTPKGSSALTSTGLWQSDMRHALTDRATWTFLNTQGVYCDIQARGQRSMQDLSASEWDALRRRLSSLWRRLFREIDGGHFFFVGYKGARRTGALVHRLIGEAEDFAAWRDEMFDIRQGRARS